MAVDVNPRWQLMSNLGDGSHTNQMRGQMPLGSKRQQSHYPAVEKRFVCHKTKNRINRFEFININFHDWAINFMMRPLFS
jgi:hypothetical protein